MHSLFEWDDRVMHKQCFKNCGFQYFNKMPVCIKSLDDDIMNFESVCKLSSFLNQKEENIMKAIYYGYTIDDRYGISWHVKYLI